MRHSLSSKGGDHQHPPWCCSVCWAELWAARSLPQRDAPLPGWLLMVRPERCPHAGAAESGWPGSSSQAVGSGCCLQNPAMSGKSRHGASSSLNFLLVISALCAYLWVLFVVHGLAL